MLSQHRQVRRAPAWGLGALLLVTMSGCAQDVDPGEALLGALPTTQVEVDGQDELVRECMRAAGFAFDRSVDPSPQTRPNPLGIAFLNDDVEAARGTGYAVATLASSEEGDGPEAYFVALDGDGSDVESFTLSGGTVVEANSDGCVAEARIAVYGSVRDFLRLANLPNEVLNAAEPLPTDTWNDLMDEYSSCMADEGYAVADISAASMMAEERFGGTRDSATPPGEDEVEMAVADATCQDDAQIRQTSIDYFLRAADGWIAQNKGVIVELGDMRKAAVERAKDILGT